MPDNAHSVTENGDTSFGGRLSPTASDIRLTRRGARFYRNYFLMMFSIALFVGVVLAAVFFGERRDYFYKLRSQESFALTLQTDLIKRYLANTANDLIFWTYQVEMLMALKGGAEEHVWIDRMASEYLAFSNISGHYDQIRFIDRHGKEIVRVNQGVDGLSYSTPPEQLQDKSSRPYFKEAIRLERGGIHISRMDLNVEHGEVERPYKPVIRLATPVVDQEGKTRGIVILNVLVSQMLDAIRTQAELAPGNVVLCDENGYFMLGLAETDEWGMQLEERRERRFGNLFSEAWEKISRDDSGQFSNADGLFTFSTVRPFSPLKGPLQEVGSRWIDFRLNIPYGWKLVSFMPAMSLFAPMKRLFWELVFLWGLIISGLALMVMYVMESVRKRRIYQRRIYHYAHYDLLTDLPNRVLFFDRLDQLILQFSRYGGSFALLFVDLDGFKAVNDEHGHEVGDEALRTVAKRFKDLLRASDTVARVGGDEFTVLLPSVTNIEKATEVADRIVRAIAPPMVLAGNRCQLGASVGVVLFPLHGETSQALIQAADQAMYQAKAAGKSTFRLADVPKP